MKQIPLKKVELFCGTGGVGKTTMGNTYFFVKNKRESIRNFFSNLDNKRLVTKVISIFIESSYAQENSQNLLKNLLYSKITEAMKFALTSSFNTLIDGMINKCGPPA